MRHILYFACVIALAVVTSCGTKPGEAQADGTSTVTPLNINGNGLPQAPSPATTPVTNTSQPITAPNITTPGTTTTVQQQPTTSSSTANGMNPAHGQPGHRCEIEVGAPLNSAPTKNAATTPTVTSTPATISQKPTITTSTPTITSTPSTVKTAPGMNPPHGQPGHRCDITVGEPLNSKPAAVTPTTTTTTTPTATPVVNSNVTPGSIKPSIVNTTPTITTPTTTTTTAVKTAPGMNPAHGQPGHRCEIAVGAPLDSKPEPLKVVTPEKKN